MLMDYLHKYPNAVIRFHASNMILKICSDAVYLVLPEAKSRVAVHFHLGWQNNPTRVNGAVAVLCQTLNLLSVPPLKPKSGASIPAAAIAPR
jgi:hypothetical protein